MRSLPQFSTSRGSFYLFEYARHFLHCCSRLLGLEHRSVRGLIGVDFKPPCFPRQSNFDALFLGLRVRERGTSRDVAEFLL